MKLIELKCKNCSAVLKVQPNTANIHCEHCGTNYKLDDEAKHIKYDDMEKAGYDYEKGRQKAKQEHAPKKNLAEWETVSLDEAEQAGYEREKKRLDYEHGKQRAQKEYEETQRAYEEEKRRKQKEVKRATRKQGLVSFGWSILLVISVFTVIPFPITLTCWIWLRSMLNNKGKTIATGAIWVVSSLICCIILRNNNPIYQLYAMSSLRAVFVFFSVIMTCWIWLANKQSSKKDKQIATILIWAIVLLLALISNL